VEYREIDPGDDGEVLAFLLAHEWTTRDVLPEHYVEKSPEAMQERVATLRRRLAERGERFHCLGAFRGPALVGALYIEVWDIDGRDAAHIHGLWVDPEARRQGIGRELKERAEAWGRAAGCALMDANVLVQNAPMRALNEDLGYEVVRYNYRKELGDPE
jgi:aminoglycoside 6'-N-acetyltransferase I